MSGGCRPVAASEFLPRISGRAVLALLAATALVSVACGGDGSTARVGDAEPTPAAFQTPAPEAPREDTVLAVAWRRTLGAVFIGRYAAGEFAVQRVARGGEPVALTYAPSGEAWLALLGEDGTALLRSRDDGRSFEEVELSRPDELRTTHHLLVEEGTIWVTRRETIPRGSAGPQPVVHEVWRSESDGEWELVRPLTAEGFPGTGPGGVAFARRAGRLEAYVSPITDPSYILDVVSGDRVVLEALGPSVRIASLSTFDDAGWLAVQGFRAAGPTPVLFAATADEPWSEQSLPEAADFGTAFGVDFVDRSRGALCGRFRREPADPEEAICLLTDDGGRTWDSTIPLPGVVGSAAKFVYTTAGEIVFNVRGQLIVVDSATGGTKTFDLSDSPLAASPLIARRSAGGG